jgi:hypothetical protein
MSVAAPGLWLLQVRGCTAAGLLADGLLAAGLLAAGLLAAGLHGCLSTCELLDIPGNK